MKKIIGIFTCFLAFTAITPETFSRADMSMMGKRFPKLDVTYAKEKPNLDGKALLVEFWATWCIPCFMSIPHLNDLQRKYNARGLEVISITNEDLFAVAKFMKVKPMNYNVAVDPANFYAANFRITGVPHAFVVNKAGTVVWEGNPL